MTLSSILPEILKIQILIMNQMVNLHLVLTWFIPSPCMRYTLNVILIWKFSPVVIKMNFRSYAIENQIDFMIRTKDFFCIFNKKIPKDKHFLIFRDLFKSHLFYCYFASFLNFSYGDGNHCCSFFICRYFSFCIYCCHFFVRCPVCKLS